MLLPVWISAGMMLARNAKAPHPLTAKQTDVIFNHFNELRNVRGDVQGKFHPDFSGCAKSPLQTH